MASTDAVLAFLTELHKDNPSDIVTTQSKLDIELYLQNYTGAPLQPEHIAIPANPAIQGRTRFQRLMHIGRKSVPLCVDSLKAAVNEAKAGLDVTRYKDAWDVIRKVAPNEPEATRDEVWIEETEQRVKTETNRLEAELKQYRNNLIKESIRMANEELGRFFESAGKLSLAHEAFGRMRQDVSTTKHIIDCSLQLGSLALQRGDFAAASVHATKVSTMPQPDEDKASDGLAKVLAGVSYMGQGNYTEAARNLLLIDFATPPSTYSHIASPNDIAVYGGLLALATMGRADLQRRVLDNQSFRTFLENEPQVRKAISLFVNGRYSNCLAMLEGNRPEYKLDVYLSGHLDKLFSKIRTKCITQYFIPFSHVTLDSLSEAFAQPNHNLEQELLQMIKQGSLKAKIDVKSRLLVAENPDPRAEMQREAIKVAQDYERESKERLRRMSIVCAGLEVVGSKKNMMSQLATPGMAIDSSFLEQAQYEDM